MLNRREVVIAPAALAVAPAFGQGNPFVVCRGAFTVADEWARFARELGRSHTVYVYDRRGRGLSPYAGPPYTMSCEIEDLAAVVALAGEPTAILGHSFGGGCALAFALSSKFQGRLILYEPVHSVPRQLSRGYLPELESIVESGTLDRATEFALINIARVIAVKYFSVRGQLLFPSHLWEQRWRAESRASLFYERGRESCGGKV